MFWRNDINLEEVAGELLIVIDNFELSCSILTHDGILISTQNKCGK